MTRFAPSLLALVLCGTAMAGCADSTAVAADPSTKTASEQAADIASITKNPVNDVEGGVRQAQQLRTAEHYAEAIHILSQLMLVASDNPRVVGEYGKTLAAMGRAQDATQFLNRAIELAANDWTVYSALGVSYDQLGDQVSARAAYERALAMKPAEPSVLNNYALSRMLANDPNGAHILIERARIAGGDSDPKIAANIAMLNQMTPPGAPGVAQGPAPQQNLAYAVQRPAPQGQPSQQQQQAPRQVAAAPRPLQPQMAPQQMAQQQQMPQQRVNQQQAPQQQYAQQDVPSVIMQAVPFDPLAGPVKPRPAARKVARVAKPDNGATADAAAPPAIKTPVKTADARGKNVVPSLRMAAGGY